MHIHINKPARVIQCHRYNMIVAFCLAVFIAAAWSPAAEHDYEPIAVIRNGGDAPPLVQLEYFNASDPRQIASGDAVASVHGSREALLRCNSVRRALRCEA